MTAWSGIPASSVPFNEARVGVDNDGEVVFMDRNNNRLLLENGERFTPAHLPQPTVCDNRLMDAMHPKPKREKLSRVPNRKMRRKARKGGSK